MRKHFWVVAGLFLMVLLFTTHGLKAQDNDMDGELQKDIQQLLANPKRTERTRQIFIRTALKGEDPAAVAALFGSTRNNVDQIKNRMTAELKELAMRLADER